MSVEAFYGLYAHFQLVSGFTNAKLETFRKKSYICGTNPTNTMAKIKLSNEDVMRLSNASDYQFPKYTSQIINWANQNAQGTRANVVGQMSDLIQEFDGQTLDEWITWYDAKMPDAIEKATDKIYEMVDKIREAAPQIDRQMVNNWVKDLVYNKTFCGLRVQQAIIAHVANICGKPWRLARADEESKNIDGYIGDTPVQIKSYTFKVEKHLNQSIEIPIIYYEKKKTGLEIEFDGFDLSLF